MESTDFDSHGEEDLHASIQSSGSSTGSRPRSSAERRAAHRAQRSAGSRAGELEEGRTGELEEDRTEDEGTEGRRKGQPSSGRRTSKQKRRKSHDRRASKQVEHSKSAMEDADRDSTSVEMESEGREQAGVADEEAGVGRCWKSFPLSIRSVGNISFHHHMKTLLFHALYHDCPNLCLCKITTQVQCRLK